MCGRRARCALFKSHKLQFEIVAVLGRLALFTHIHLFWVAGLLLVLRAAREHDPALISCGRIGPQRQAPPGSWKPDGALFRRLEAERK